ncbi:MAG: hypothetical protein BGO14_04240 [Chlamydiales bacterium 38-26]|nr:hypothetical protein [Chlamydiales bacterium]OJV07706.1 MAG: hypothetical protein BGO14_04240 [Chlamydiales bacterium 38-26]
MSFLKDSPFNLFLLVLAPWKRIGLTHFDRFSVNINPFKYRSLSKFLWKEQGGKLTAQFILKLFTFFNQLFFLLCLAQVVGDVRLSSYPNLPFYALPVSIFLRYVLSQLQLWVEFSLRHFYVQCLHSTFDKVVWKAHETLDRIFGRDVLASLQAVPFLVDGFYLITAFLSSLAIIFWINGFDAIIGILTLGLFIPFSLKIGNARSFIAKQIYAVVKEKLDRIHHWLDWHLYLRSWGTAESFLFSIQKLMYSEVKLRNQDSIWRGCDLYSISFGKLVPIAVIISLSLWAFPISSGLLTTLWLAVPIIRIIITYNRFKKEKAEGYAAFDELKKYFYELGFENSSSTIEVQNAWEIWKGSLGDNICEFYHEFDVLSKLHLREEFLNNKLNPFEVELELKGKNVSSGQRVRLLLARGINLALMYSQPLYVYLNFESLDATNRQRVSECLKDLSFWIPVYLKTEIGVIIEQEKFPLDAIAPLRQELKSKQVIANIAMPSLLKDILRLCRPYFFFLLLPAIGLNVLASLTVLNISDQWRLTLLLLVGLGAFTGVLWLGRKIESHVREWALDKGFNILKHPTEWSRSDFFQRISENYKTVCERISWYVHDGAWIASLLAFALISSLYVIGWISLAIGGFFIGLCYYIWRVLNPAIVLTRQSTIVGLNRYLENMANLVALSSSASVDILKTKQKEISYEALKALFISQIESDATKFSFGTILYLLSGVLVMSLSILSLYVPYDEAVIASMISAFLYVDYNITMFFQALTGFDAQRIAIHRLAQVPLKQQELKSLFVKQENSYYTTEFFNPLIDLKYPTHSFQSGNSYSILGDSGTGKTLYLRCLAGMQPCNELSHASLPRESVAYLDRHALNVIKRMKSDAPETVEIEHLLVHFIEEQLQQMKRIFIFDEALVHFSLEQAKKLSQSISERIEAFQGLFLLVDHRFQLKNTIALQKIHENP